MELISIDNKLSEFATTIPEKVAIEFGKETVTYKSLEKRTNYIADFLIGKCFEKNIFVMLGRSITLVETLIGIIKSNKIFIPIECELPNNRIMSMFREIKTNWIITTNEQLQKLNDISEMMGIKLNIIISEFNANEGYDKYSNLDIFFINDYDIEYEKRYKYCQNEHCYIYFTSGSTGIPKAVLGRYKSLMHFIQWEINEFKIDSNFRVSQLIHPSFDAFLRDVFVPLCSGGTLCIPYGEDIIYNPIKLIDWIENNNITLIHTVPYLFKNISKNIISKKQLKSLKYVLLSGEALRGNDIIKFIDIFGDKIQLVNLYGSTETTLIRLFYTISKGDINKANIPVGKPIDSTEVLVLNEDMEICPKGVVGQIYIKTPFMTSGYYNDKSLSEKVFIKNPFSNDLNDIIYKTGDLGRTNEDNNIEIIGREDNQIKINGIRIELGEIENHMLNYKDMNEVVVIPKEDEKGDNYICAYFVSNKKYSTKELRLYLSDLLPHYMIPSYFIQIEKFSLNLFGKVDRNILPDPFKDVNKNIEYISPRNDLERKIADIWYDILDLSDYNISILDNFFELGGNSILAIRFIYAIKEQFKIDLSTVNFYKDPTIYAIHRSITSMYQDVNIINEYLFKRFGEKCKIISYHINDQTVNILFTDKLTMNIMNYLKSEFNYKVFPNYATNYDKIFILPNHAADIKYQDLDSILRLKTANQEIMNEILNKYRVNYKALKDDILSGEIKQNHEIGFLLSDRCKMHHKNNKNDIMNFIITNDNYLDDSVVDTIILKLINEQPVFRMIIDENTNYYQFEEYEIIKEFHYSIIDISQYCMESKVDIIKQLVEEMNSEYNDMDYLRNLLYRFAILKLDNKTYSMLLCIDHIISDPETERIIKKYFSLSDDQKLNPPLYTDYIKEAYLTNDSNKFEEYRNSYMFSEFKTAAELFEQKYPEYIWKGSGIVFSEPFIANIDLKSNIFLEPNISPMQYALYIGLKIISEIFNIEYIPIRIFINSRFFNFKDYYLTIGDFSDAFNIAFQVKEGTISTFHQEYVRAIDYLTKDRIHTKGLAKDLECSRYFRRASPFTFSYVGNLTKIEDKKRLSQLKNMNSIGYPILAYCVNDDILRIIMYNGIEENKVNNIKKILKNIGIDFGLTFVSQID